MSDRPLSYLEFPPGERARDVALTYWSFSVRALPDPSFVHRVWPDGCVTLTLACAGGRGIGAYLLGVRQGPYEVPLHPGVRYWGVRFRPEAGAWWLGVPPSQLREQNVMAASLLGPSVTSLADAVAAIEDEAEVALMFDAWIAERPSPARPVDEIVRAAVAAIVATDGKRAMADIAVDVGVSARVLQRRFMSSVGISPKAFAVLRRGRSAIKRVAAEGFDAKAGRWSEVALSSGFADQAHFTREVARLTRFAPTALRDRLDTISHERLID